MFRGDCSRLHFARLCVCIRMSLGRSEKNFHGLERLVTPGGFTGRCVLCRPAGPGLRQRDSVVTVSSQKSPLLSARGSCGRGSGVGRPGPRRPWAPSARALGPVAVFPPHLLSPGAADRRRFLKSKPFIYRWAALLFCRLLWRRSRLVLSLTFLMNHLLYHG